MRSSEYRRGGCAAGLTYADITLSNPKAPDVAKIEVRALVDTGAAELCLPEKVASQLRLEKVMEREVTLADGKRHVVPFVGPVQINFGKSRNRGCFTGAYVLGERVLTGLTALEAMDLVIEPLSRKVIVNPESPNIPSGIAM
jgi:clan AA aspartic protease